MLDVLQIFGRAGRPQFDTSGHGMILTPHNKLHKYLSLLTNQIPIESCFIQHLVNNLNAEVSIITYNIIIIFIDNLTTFTFYNIFLISLYFIGRFRNNIKCRRSSYVVKLYLFICKNAYKSSCLWHNTRGS